MGAELAYIREVENLPVSDAAKAVERAERIDQVAQAMAGRALELATDPATPQGDAAIARVLHARLITPDDKLKKAQSLRRAMAGWFRLDEEDFFIVRSTRFNDRKLKDETITSVVYGAAVGIDIRDPGRTNDPKGNWQNVNSPLLPVLERFAVVDTTPRPWKFWDTRKGLTFPVYSAMIAAAKNLGLNPLPDSPETQRRTFLTGEYRGELLGRAAWVDAESTPRQSTDIFPEWGSEGRYLVRPTATVEDGIELSPGQMVGYRAKHLSM